MGTISALNDPTIGTVSKPNGRIPGVTLLPSVFLFGEFIDDLDLEYGVGGVTVPTIGDANGNRLGFDGANWTSTDAEQPRFYGTDGYFMEGEATELSGYSADIGNWANVTTAAVAQDAIGLTGAANEAFTLTDSSAVARQDRALNTTITSGSDTYYAVARVGYNASPSVYPYIRVQAFGGTLVTEAIVLDPSDGTYTEPSSGGSVVSITRVGGFWVVILSITDNASGNNVAQLNLSPAYNTNGSTAQDNAAQGSTVFASCELYKTTWSYSPILTTGGTTKTRLADVEATLDLANWNDGDISCEFEWTPFFTNASGGSMGVVTPSSSDLFKFIYSNTTNNRAILSDGPNSQTLNNAWAESGQTMLVKVRANATTSKMQFSIDGVSGVELTYDGSFNPSGAITLFKSLTLGAAMKNLKIWHFDQKEHWLTE